MSSLETAAEILKCFTAETPELAVSEVAKQLGLPKSTASRVLKSMADCGLVEQLPDTRRYAVGMLPFRLGQLYQSRVRVLEMVEAEVERLVEETGFTAYIGVRNGADIVVLRRRHGRYPVRMMLDPGYRVAAFATAIGKTLLARLSDAELRALLPPVLVHETTQQRKRLAAFIAELAPVRARLWAETNAETFPGMGAIGAAVGSADEQQPVGFSLSFPIGAVTRRRREDMVEHVVAAAARIAAKSDDPVWARRGERRAAG
jgi:DNA-binding IclR family transcriptional regulator